MLNLDYINGYLNAMRCLNAGPNHACDYSMNLLDNKGNFTDTLAHHFQSIVDGQGQCFDELNKCYLYQIETTPPIWYAT